MRLLITGSRDWPDAFFVHDMIFQMIEDRLPDVLTVVHGANKKGADAAAKSFVERYKDYEDILYLELNDDPYPAEWNKYGRGAGPVRNREMAKSGIDLCLAFNYNQSPGTSDMIGVCERYDIEVIEYTEEDI